MGFKFKNKFLLTITIIFCLFVGIGKAFAQYKAPNPVGYVNDFAHVLSVGTITRLDGIIGELKSKTGAEVVVVILSTLDGYPIEDIGLEIGRQWKVGQTGKNNGVIIVSAINDKKLRIEVGYGLEGFLTDAHAGRIRDNYMVPSFKKGDYENGIIYGTSAVVSAIAKGYGVSISGNYNVPESIQQDSEQGSGQGSGLFNLIFFLLFLFLFIKYPSFMLGFFIGGGFGGGGSSGGGFGGGSGFGGFGGI